MRNNHPYSRPFNLISAALLMTGAALASSPSRATAAGSGNVSIGGQIPQSVSSGAARPLHPHDQAAPLEINFGLPLRDEAALNTFVASHVPRHQFLTRGQIDATYAPTEASVNAVETWARSKGLVVTYASSDGLAITVRGTTARVESAFHVQINDYRGPAGRIVYSADREPTVPEALGLQTITGLDDFDRVVPDAVTSSTSRTNRYPSDASRPAAATKDQPGSYFPVDLRQLYDETGNGLCGGNDCDGSGQMIGITLWGAQVPSSDLSAFATASGDPALTTIPYDASNPVNPTNDQVQFIPVDGSSTDTTDQQELAMDVEYAHGMAPHSALKVFLANCTPVSGGCNAGATNSEDVLSAAANDTSIHIISDSWSYDQESCDPTTYAQCFDPFVVQTTNTLKAAAAAGTTFYFATGDAGTAASASSSLAYGMPAYPASSPYVVAVGGTALYNTANSSSATGYSTELAWSDAPGEARQSAQLGGAGGSGCSIFARPSWQTGVSAATCPGRATPDIAAEADPGTGIQEQCQTCNYGSDGLGLNGGTSLAAPLVAGMAAVTQNAINALTHGTHPMGFAAPTIYALANDAARYHTYFHDVTCGNNAFPVNTATGNPAGPGWDEATGWGSEDWKYFTEGYANTLGASLSIPTSSAPTYPYSCQPGPTNAPLNGISCPSTTTCYAVGDVANSSFLGGTNGSNSVATGPGSIVKTTNGGASWLEETGDIEAVACGSASSCVEVGDGGRVRSSGNANQATPTWTDRSTPTRTPLTGVTCPSASVCYAIGTGGTLLKSSNGGSGWSPLLGIEGIALDGIACPSTTECLAVDVSGNLEVTTDGGASWNFESTPANGLNGVACADSQSCFAVGAGTMNGTSVGTVVATTDASSTNPSWATQTVPNGTNVLAGISCPGATSVTCVAVGVGGTIIAIGNGATPWTAQNSTTSQTLQNVTCADAAHCAAVGSGGTILGTSNSGTTWSVQTSGTQFTLYGVSCADAADCQAVGQQGITLQTTNGGSTWTLAAGGGTTQNLQALSCPTTDVCFAVGASGTILNSTDGGQTWNSQTSGDVGATLDGISCVTNTTCVAVGPTGSSNGVIELTTDGGSTWNPEQSNSNFWGLTAVSCVNTTPMACVATAGPYADVSTDGGATWSTSTSGIPPAARLSSVSCPMAVTSATVTCFAVDTAGDIFQSSDTGTVWAQQATSPTSTSLNAVSCSSATACIIAGQDGTILTTSDGGTTTWQQQANPVSGPLTALDTGPFNNLFAASCPSSATCFVSGAKGLVLASSNSSPTITHVLRFAAQRHGSTVAFRWRLASSTGIAGFDLYANSHRLNTRLIRVHRRLTYRYHVRWAGDSGFELQVILTDGQRVTITPR